MDNSINEETYQIENSTRAIVNYDIGHGGELGASAPKWSMALVGTTWKQRENPPTRFKKENLKFYGRIY